MSKIYNPHDRLFKETFGDVAVTQDFLENYLPDEMLEMIELESLVTMKETFIQEELKDTQSDLLCKVEMQEKEVYLYFLFEHKSYPSKDIAFQLLGYMLEIWNRDLHKANKKELSVIIPLVIYHGKRKWENPKTIGNWLKGYDELPPGIKKSVPNFDFVYYDFSLYDIECVL